DGLWLLERNTNAMNFLNATTNGVVVFQINSNGNLSVVNSISYVWPTAQGAAGTVLTNNGAGVLGWGAVSGTGGTGNQIWTNDGKFFYPSGTIVSNTAQIVIATNNGGIEI